MIFDTTKFDSMLADVATLCNADNQQNTGAIQNVVSVVLKTDTFISQIENDVLDIVKNGFGTDDIPAVINLVIQSEQYVQTIESTAMTNLVLDLATILKYVIYGLIDWIMLSQNSSEINDFKTSFSTLWSLVQLALPSSKTSAGCACNMM